MLAFIIRGIFLLSVLGWYSAMIWKLIDGYFQDQFRAYLQEEYQRIKADGGAVDKKSAPSAFPVESSLSHGTAETYDFNMVSPADIADACPRTIGKSKETVAGGTSEIAAVDAGITDKSTFAMNAARSMQESRKSPSGSDTRDKERRPGAINQDGDRKEDSVLSSPAFTHRAAKPRNRIDKTKLYASKEFSRQKSRKKSRNRRMNTRVLIFADFPATSDNRDDDFSEFEEEGNHKGVRKEGILVSELPFKPKADIGNLDRVTADEFCPLILEDETSCRETNAWP